MSQAVAMACEAELQQRTAGEAYEAEQGLDGIMLSGWLATV